MNTLDSLREMGLTDPEADMYKVLLKTGAVPASEAAKMAGIKRTTAYSLLQNLKEKGFVGGLYRDNRQYFYAEQPERVSKRYEKRLKSFIDIIPSLTQTGSDQKEFGGIRPISTLAELKDFYRDILEEYKNKSYRIIGNGQDWEVLDPEFFIKFRKDRGAAKIRTRLLLDSRFAMQNPEEKYLLRTWKFLPEEYMLNGVIDIFDDKVLIVSTELRSLAVVLAVPAMVGIFKTMFDVIWDGIPGERKRTKR